VTRGEGLLRKIQIRFPFMSALFLRDGARALLIPEKSGLEGLALEAAGLKTRQELASKALGGKGTEVSRCQGAGATARKGGEPGRSVWAMASVERRLLRGSFDDGTRAWDVATGRCDSERPGCWRATRWRAGSSWSALLRT
jgi:hypothetical protein